MTTNGRVTLSAEIIDIKQSMQHIAFKATKSIDEDPLKRFSYLINDPKLDDEIIELLVADIFDILDERDTISAKEHVDNIHKCIYKSKLTHDKYQLLFKNVKKFMKRLIWNYSFDSHSIDTGTMMMDMISTAISKNLITHDDITDILIDSFKKRENKTILPADAFAVIAVILPSVVGTIIKEFALKNVINHKQRCQFFESFAQAFLTLKQIKPEINELAGQKYNDIFFLEYKSGISSSDIYNNSIRPVIASISNFDDKYESYMVPACKEYVNLLVLCNHYAPDEIVSVLKWFQDKDHFNAYLIEELLSTYLNSRICPASDQEINQFIKAFHEPITLINLYKSDHTCILNTEILSLLKYLYPTQFLKTCQPYLDTILNEFKRDDPLLRGLSDNAKAYIKFAYDEKLTVLDKIINRYMNYAWIETECNICKTKGARLTFNIFKQSCDHVICRDCFVKILVDNTVKITRVKCPLCNNK